MELAIANLASLLSSVTLDEPIWRYVKGRSLISTVTAHVARSLSVAGERSKDDVARAMHSLRLARHELPVVAGSLPTTTRCTHGRS